MERSIELRETETAYTLTLNEVQLYQTPFTIKRDAKTIAAVISVGEYGEFVAWRERTRPLSTRAYAQVLEILATAPTSAEILAFRPSPAIQTEVNRLLSKHKAGTLTPDEESELDRIGDLEHILIALKARARQQLDQSDGK